MNTTNITNLQQQRTIYKGTYTQDTYDCFNEDNEITSSFFPEITQETVRGLKDRRDMFQREINQIYAITNSLDDDNFDKEFVTILQEYINRGRQLLRIKNGDSVKLSGVVNIMSEGGGNSVRRSFHSRNC